MEIFLAETVRSKNLAKISIFLGVLTSNYVFAQDSCNSEETTTFCANPVRAENNVDIKWFHENVEKGWRSQFTNDFFRKRLASWFRGKYIAREDELSKLCLNSGIDFLDEHHIIGSFRGFGDQIVTLNCSDTNFIFDCDFYNSKMELKDTAKLYLTYFDGKEDHNLLGIVMCFPNGDVGWQASTVSESISPEETDTIIAHFKKLGFKTDRVVSTQSPSCNLNSENSNLTMMR